MFRMISMSQLETYLGQERDFTLLDVRSRAEFEQNRLEGAINIPLEELNMRYQTIPRDRPVVVYCAHGGQSMQAARMLARLGFDAVNADGGLTYYRGSHLQTGMPGQEGF